MSNKLHHSSQALAKVVALSAMCHDFAEQLEFSYYQEFSASFDGISVDFKWEKKGDVKTLHFIVSGARSGIFRTLFSYNLFDYNSEEDSILYNNESLIEGLFETSKGYVTSDADSPEFSLQVKENQRKYDMSVLINDYILSAGKIMAEKIHS
jgi:hypothetical protein